MKVAIFGGAFSPIHSAHLELASRFREVLNLEKVIFVPTFISPHKQNTEVSFDDRLTMCKLATKNYPYFEVSDIEGKRKGKSYSYETIEYFADIFGKNLYMIVGADMYLSLLEWKNPERIFQKATILACPRDTGTYEKMTKYSKKLLDYGCKSVILDEPIFDLSSSIVREKIKNNEDISNFVDKDVAKFIKTNKLYGCV